MIYVISFVLLVGLTNSVLADWTGAVSSDWYNAGNWTGAVPASGETTLIESLASITWPIINGGTADTGQLRIGYTAAYQGELTVTGGATLNVNGELRIGRKSANGSGQAVGILHISGDTTTINVTERIEHGRHGDATINMSGGYLHCDAELRLAYREDAFSKVYLSGGTIDLGGNPGITVGNDSTPGFALIDISGDGTLTLAGNQVSTIESLVSDGIITAYGGTGPVLIAYDGQTDITTVETIGGPDASEPNPVDEQADVPRDAVLSWKTGTGADKHDVYLGTSFDDVSNATTTVDPGGVYQGRIDPNIYTPAERLEFGQTCYWRIDEVEGAISTSKNGTTIHKGDVWSFTAELFAYTIENIIATALSSEEGKGPGNTVNGSGLDSSGLLHGNESVDNVWLSSRDGAQPTWIEYEFDKAYKLHQMWVWNSNDSLEPLVGFGFKDVTIEYSVNGTDYTTLGTTHEFAQAPGAADYAHNTTVDFGGVAATYVRLTANSNWGGIFNQYGLSEVRFFYIPIHARGPNPDSGATDVELDLTLSWIAGRQAAPAALGSDQNPPLAGHDVYFSSDEQAVIDGTVPVAAVTETSHGPLALDLGTTYYWRVDEVNDAETPATWLGDIWNFTTHEYFVLDDFESYNDIDPPDPESNRIFESWIDGFGAPTNGALVGNDFPPYTEQNIVHGGRQSMPFFYDNSVGNSEASMTLSSQRDWTVRGVGELSLWFRGYPASFSSFTEGPVGTYTMTARSENISGQSDHFHYVYKQLSGPGSIVVKVESVTNTSNSAKAGVMIRETLDSDSKHALVFSRPDGGVRFRRRTETAEDDTNSTDDNLAIPHWVKLERDIAGLFTASHSTDGINFVPINDISLGSSDTVQMNAVVYIGLALSSNNPEETCQAVFSEVSTTGTIIGQWQSQDIDIPSNDPEPMYVALNDNAVVYHDNPNAAQIDTWTEWNIDLQAFADQGVNLTNVDKIAIGFGDRNPDTSGQAGGSGTMYFDDIRLYPLRPEPEPEPQQ